WATSLSFATTCRTRSHQSITVSGLIGMLSQESGACCSSYEKPMVNQRLEDRFRVYRSGNVMDLSKYECPVCAQSRMRISPTFWQCEGCGEKYATVKGVPKLYREEDLGQRDRALRDSFYNGFLGKYYSHVMPFL